VEQEFVKIIVCKDISIAKEWTHKVDLDSVLSLELVDLNVNKSIGIKYCIHSLIRTPSQVNKQSQI